jgi:hypothetical protein
LKKILLITAFSISFLLGGCAMNKYNKGTSTTQSKTYFDAFDDFSYVSNPVPDGAWSYGYTGTLGGDFNLYTTQSKSYQQHSSLPLRVWQGPGNYDPNVIKNDTGTDMYSHDGVFNPKSSYLHFHPGPRGEYSVIRWTCQTSGTYKVSAGFRSLRTINPPTTTDIHVLQNNASLFDGAINGFYVDGEKTYEGTLKLNIGDRIDFTVGYGDDKDYGYDSSGLKATIEKIDQ